MLKISKVLSAVAASVLVAALALTAGPAHAQSAASGSTRHALAAPIHVLASATAGQPSPDSNQTTITYIVRADIDGHSRLILRGKSARWFHISFAAPGKHNGKNKPTVINGAKWFPKWPEPGENRNCDCHSSTFWNVMPPVPQTAEGFFFDGVNCRDRCSGRYSGGILCINFNDDPSPSDAWYEVKIVLTVDGAPRLS